MPAPDPAQRDRILREAIDILVKDGPRALTVRAVAAAAGCSTTGVYTYFDGRPGLLNAIVIDGFERLDLAVDAAARGIEPGAEEVAARCRGYVDFARSRPAQYALMFGEPIAGEARSPEASARGGESFVKLRNSVADGVAAGTLDVAGQSAALVAGSVWATLHGHAVLEQQWPPDQSHDLPWTHDVEAAIAWLLRGVASRP